MVGDGVGGDGDGWGSGGGTGGGGIGEEEELGLVLAGKVLAEEEKGDGEEGSDGDLYGEGRGSQELVRSSHSDTDTGILFVSVCWLLLVKHRVLVIMDINLV